MAAVELVPVSEEHLAALEALVIDPAVLRFTRVPSPPPPGFAEGWLKICQQGRADGTREAFAITGDDGGGFLGIALAPRIDRAARTVELGYMVCPEARGRGVAGAALTLLTEWALTELDAHRLELLISVANLPSQRVAARCGYHREGVLRSFHVKQGVREDTEIWSRLATDPPPG